MRILFFSLFAVLSIGTLLVSPAVADEKQTDTTRGVENPSYVLGAGDGILIWALGADEIGNKPYTVLPDGYLDLPLLGRVRAGGKTVEQFKLDLRQTLKQYFNDPQVSVSVTDFRSQPVSILGSVNEPGVHQLEGGKSLLEVLSLAGGTAPDADSTAVVTRHAEWGPIPVPDSTKDASGQFYSARINLQALTQAKSPQFNIRIFPNDVIEVPKARMIYVLGEVSKPGGYILHQNENVTAAQALGMAGGPTPFGATKNARLLRVGNDSVNRQESKVDLRSVLEGKGEDTLLRPEDILYIPGNLSKKASLRAMESAIQISTGLIIWRR